jgi:hypothetical protein
MLAVGLLGILPALVAADEARLPAGTLLYVRLTRHLQTHAVSPGEAVETVLIAPVLAGDRMAAAPGWKVRGKVAEKGTGRDRRARLGLAFSEIVDSSGKATAIVARVQEVDNAREGVDPEGRIVAMPSMKGLPRDPLSLLALAADLDPVALGLLEPPKGMLHASVGYDRGAEMTLRLTQPAVILAAPEAERGKEIAADPALKRLVNAQPIRALAPSGGQPTALMNVLFGASREELEAAFAEAGWSAANTLWTKAAPAAFLSLASKYGYAASPASQASLEGRAPDLAFEKQNNTLAKRHQVRLWKTEATFRGKPVWVGAATHAIRLEFRGADKTFVYRLDTDVDEERAKVTRDLDFAGRLAGQALVERPTAPRSLETVAGDVLKTDAAMAVLVLR